MRVLGIDPGSGSWDLFGYEVKNFNMEVFLDRAFPTSEIKSNPDHLIDQLKSVLPLDCVTLPSGFGLPLTSLESLSNEDLSLITLRKASEIPTMGLAKILQKLKVLKIPGYIIPGVKHFPSISRHRKINTVDMGTADKVCSVVSAIVSLQELKRCSLTEINFLLLEVGRGFSAVIGIEHGRIIDGIGGTNMIGISSLGAIDGELAYLMEIQHKKDLLQGGIKHISLASKIHSKSQVSSESTKKWDDFSFKEEIQQFSSESPIVKFFIEKTAIALLTVLSSFKSFSSDFPVIISASGVDPKWLSELLENYFRKGNPLTRSLKFQFIPMQTYAKVSKSAAQGAAFIAEGIKGGRYHDILSHLGFFETEGSILDEIYVKTKKL